MKVCIPTNGQNGLTEQVSEHFGSAPFFTIVNTETKEVEILPNLNQHHQHGACRPTAAIQDKEVDIVICAGMGSRAVTLLNQAGIKAYKVSGQTVKEALEALSTDSLVEINPANACKLHDCDH